MIITIFQAVFAIIAIVLITLQEPVEDRGKSTSFFAPMASKRGWEKITFILTISSIIIFILLSLARLVLDK